MTVPHATNDDMPARRQVGLKSPGACTSQDGHQPLFIQGFPTIPALARVALGCEVRKVGRDMLIGILFVRRQGGDQSWLLVRIAEEGG